MSGGKMLCFQRNWFRADLCEMARSCSKLQQVDKLRKYVESSTIKVFYWGPLRVLKALCGAAALWNKVRAARRAYRITLYAARDCMRKGRRKSFLYIL